MLRKVFGLPSYGQSTVYLASPLMGVWAVSKLLLLKEALQYIALCLCFIYSWN